VPWRVPLLAALLAQLLLGCLLACDSRPALPEQRSNVLMITVDTLRRDHLSLHGYARNTSPSIDSLAERGWVFENHISHSSQTVPSTISMMVSQYPVEHGYQHVETGQFAQAPPRYSEELLFLAEVLSQRGYATAAFVANPFLREKNRFDQGFDHFLGHEEGTELTKAARQWMSAHIQNDDDAPFFIYLHYMEVHSPYEPPRKYRALYPPPLGAEGAFTYGLAPDTSDIDLQFERNLYDAQINQVDELIGRVLSRVEKLGISGDTVVIFTSDHGEEFLEHGGFGHGTTVYGELVRIPLVIAVPGKLDDGRRVTHLTRAIDLAPSLLEWLEIPRPESYRGDSLLTPADVAYAEDGPWRAAYSAEGKIVVHLEEGATQIFASDDPLDQQALDDPALEERLKAVLAPYLELEAKSGAQPPADSGDMPSWSSEELERLKALGYVHE
jgi:arylsulfatase A-like enzyme